MTSVHIDMQITNAMFNALVEDLQVAMDERKVPFSMQNKLLHKLAPMQRQIVTR
jgi:hemoglobin